MAGRLCICCRCRPARRAIGLGRRCRRALGTRARGRGPWPAAAIVAAATLFFSVPRAKSQQQLCDARILGALARRAASGSSSPGGGSDVLCHRPCALGRCRMPGHGRYHGWR